MKVVYVLVGVWYFLVRRKRSEMKIIGKFKGGLKLS